MMVLKHSTYKKMLSWRVGVDEERLYHDYVSSKKDSRPGLEACFKALQPGNTLIVWKLDRFKRKNYVKKHDGIWACRCDNTGRSLCH